VNDKSSFVFMEMSKKSFQHLVDERKIFCNMGRLLRGLTPSYRSLSKHVKLVRSLCILLLSM